MLRLGTRGSPLARAQAEWVRRTLTAAHAGLEVELVFIRTSGDRAQRGPLPAAGLKGLFVKEIEEALLARAIDAGVHSMKDMPARLPTGLAIGAVPARAAAHDVLIGGGAGGLADLAPGTRIGTASVRRRAQLLSRRPDVIVVPLRGNVDTRLARWREGTVDAVVLAAAGLARLGIEEPAARPLAYDDILPPVGQGALALECRADDSDTRAVLAAIADADAASAIAAERAFLAALGGDCNTPVAAHATIVGDAVTLRALVSDVDGRRSLAETAAGRRADAETVGRHVAERLLAAGAADLLA